MDIFARQRENSCDYIDDNIVSKSSTGLINNFERKNDVLTRLSFFPETRYYGSKKKIITWIYENIHSIDFKTVADLFGGTASVSLLFKAMDKDVVYNDALTFNTLSAKAILSNESAQVVKDVDLGRILDNIYPIDGFISKTFKNIYYTDYENKWLDGFIKYAKGVECEHIRNTLYHSVFQACLQKRPFNLFHRANLYLRLNRQVQRTFGNQTTWDTDFAELTGRHFKEISSSVWESNGKVEVLEPSDVFEVSGEYDLVYLDPPYVNSKNCDDDYLKRYHFLEGIAQYDEWSEHIDYKLKNLSFKPNGYIRKWQRKTTSKDLLFSLIEKHCRSIVVLSYTTGGYPTDAEITNFLKDKFTYLYKYSQNSAYILSKAERDELLYICMP